MKIAFKNFLMTLRRYKVASLLNIVGLTLAFVAFYIIFSQVWYLFDTLVNSEKNDKRGKSEEESKPKKRLACL